VSELTAGYKARLEYVLDQVCADLPVGGDHASRAFIAQRLISAAGLGTRSLEELMTVAREALAEMPASGSLRTA
jgi:hypothetical protein